MKCVAHGCALHCEWDLFSIFFQHIEKKNLVISNVKVLRRKFFLGPSAAGNPITRLLTLCKAAVIGENDILPKISILQLDYNKSNGTHFRAKPFLCNPSNSLRSTK